MTEFNQNPSRVLRILDTPGQTEVCVTKRGTPWLRITPIPSTIDPIDTLIAAGLATAPTDTSGTPIDYGDDALPAGVDLDAALARDRNRLV